MVIFLIVYYPCMTLDKVSVYKNMPAGKNNMSSNHGVSLLIVL